MVVLAANAVLPLFSRDPHGSGISSSVLETTIQRNQLTTLFSDLKKVGLNAQLKGAEEHPSPTPKLSISRTRAPSPTNPGQAVATRDSAHSLGTVDETLSTTSSAELIKSNPDDDVIADIFGKYHGENQEFLTLHIPVDHEDPQTAWALAKFRHAANVHHTHPNAPDHVQKTTDILSEIQPEFRDATHASPTATLIDRQKNAKKEQRIHHPDFVLARKRLATLEKEKQTNEFRLLQVQIADGHFTSKVRADLLSRLYDWADNEHTSLEQFDNTPFTQYITAVRANNYADLLAQLNALKTQKDLSYYHATLHYFVTHLSQYHLSAKEFIGFILDKENKEHYHAICFTLERMLSNNYTVQPTLTKERDDLLKSLLAETQHETSAKKMTLRRLIQRIPSLRTKLLNLLIADPTLLPDDIDCFPQLDSQQCWTLLKATLNHATAEASKLIGPTRYLFIVSLLTRTDTMSDADYTQHLFEIFTHPKMTAVVRDQLLAQPELCTQLSHIGPRLRHQLFGETLNVYFTPERYKTFLSHACNAFRMQLQESNQKQGKKTQEPPTTVHKHLLLPRSLKRILWENRPWFFLPKKHRARREAVRAKRLLEKVIGTYNAPIASNEARSNLRRVLKRYPQALIHHINNTDLDRVYAVISSLNTTEDKTLLRQLNRAFIQQRALTQYDMEASFNKHIMAGLQWGMRDNLEFAMQLWRGIPHKEQPDFAVRIASMRAETDTKQLAHPKFAETLLGLRQPNRIVQFFQYLWGFIFGMKEQPYMINVTAQHRLQLFAQAPMLVKQHPNIYHTTRAALPELSKELSSAHVLAKTLRDKPKRSHEAEDCLDTGATQRWQNRVRFFRDDTYVAQHLKATDSQPLPQLKRL